MFFFFPKKIHATIDENKLQQGFRKLYEQFEANKNDIRAHMYNLE